MKGRSMQTKMINANTKLSWMANNPRIFFLTTIVRDNNYHEYTSLHNDGKVCSYAEKEEYN